MCVGEVFFMFSFGFRLMQPYWLLQSKLIHNLCNAEFIMSKCVPKCTKFTWTMSPPSQMLVGWCEDKERVLIWNFLSYSTAADKIEEVLLSLLKYQAVQIFSAVFRAYFLSHGHVSEIIRTGMWHSCHTCNVYYLLLAYSELLSGSNVLWKAKKA